MDTEVLKQKYETAAESKETHSTGCELPCVSILWVLCEIFRKANCKVWSYVLIPLPEEVAFTVKAEPKKIKKRLLQTPDLLNNM